VFDDIKADAVSAEVFLKLHAVSSGDAAHSTRPKRSG
jgi:hypothetical protein